MSSLAAPRSAWGQSRMGQPSKSASMASARSAINLSQAPEELLRCMFDAAIASAQPALCIPPNLPKVPKGRLIVVGAGKASAAMAQAVEKNWRGELSGLVVTRYGYAVPCERIEIV